MRFDGKIALVTGAGSGIGAATARRLASEGARIILLDISRESAELTAAAIARDHGEGRTQIEVANVSDWTAVSATFARIAERQPKLDILVNNVGITAFGTVPDLTVEDWDRTLSVTLGGVFHCTKLGIPMLRAAGGGAIVNVASIAGIAAELSLPAYSAAKGGVLNFTRAIAIDHIKEGIRINAVCPGVVDTPATRLLKENTALWSKIEASNPAGRVVQPEEIAAVIAFLASEDASAMVGSAVVADNGITAWTGNPNFLG